MAAYSFLDVQAVLTGPNGSASINLGNGAAASEEGITVEFEGDKDTMTIGADGSVMHSLSAAQNGQVTVRLLKTSPVNQALQALMNAQRLSSVNWGQNAITISDTARGDLVACTQVAFRKNTGLTYAKDAGMNEWVFNAGRISPVLGAGLN